MYLFEVSPTQGRFFTMSDGQFEFANDLLVDRARDLPISLGGSDRLLSFHPFSIFETTEPGEIDSVFGHILLHCKGAVKGFGRSGVERLLNRPRVWLGGSAGASKGGGLGAPKGVSQPRNPSEILSAGARLAEAGVVLSDSYYVDGVPGSFGRTSASAPTGSIAFLADQWTVRMSPDLAVGMPRYIVYHGQRRGTWVRLTWKDMTLTCSQCKKKGHITAFCRAPGGAAARPPRR